MITPAQSQRYGLMIRDFTLSQAKAYQEHLVAGKPAEDFFTKLEKHGDHDQSSHGNWSKGMISESALYKSYEGFEPEPFEKDAIGRYLAKGHIVNDHVRKDSFGEFISDETKVQDVVDGMDSVIEAAPSLPGGELFRVISAGAVERLKKGDVINDKGYMSTTTADLSHPDNGKLLLTLATVSSGRKAIAVITNNTGKKGLFMPAVMKGQPIAEFEREVVLPRDTKLKYRGEDYIFLDDGSALAVHRFERQ